MKGYGIVMAFLRVIFFFQYKSNVDFYKIILIEGIKP